VTDGDVILEPLARLMAARRFPLVVATQDRHLCVGAIVDPSSIRQ